MTAGTTGRLSATPRHDACVPPRRQGDVMRPSNEIRLRQSPHYVLDGLHALPCGCVAAVYKTSPLDLEVVSLEARGPHCVFAQHQMGRVLGLAAPNEERMSR
jgi:hypothetical protein